MATGRPRKIATPQEFDRLVDEYVHQQREDEAPITWTGMALYLGFTHRKGIDEYGKYDGFFHSVKRAKLIVEHAYEQRLNRPKPTGAIFALKNMGWSDRQQMEHLGPGGGPVKVEWVEEVVGSEDEGEDA